MLLCEDIASYSNYVVNKKKGYVKKMPRTPRIHSQSGFYHVMLRGINRQQVFYDTEDHQYFISLLDKYKTICGYKLHAYCLMGNHVHLLLQIQAEPLHIIMKRLGDAFVYWYNLKYKRTGHLFQGRYRSEPVDSDRYYMIVLRYILRNPVKAGLCISPERYPYGSAAEYILEADGITDKDYALQMMTYDQWREYISQDVDDECLEIRNDTIHRVTDTEALNYILMEFGSSSVPISISENRDILNVSIRRLLLKGISIRQLCRLTGLSKKVIERGKRGMK